MPIDDRDEVEIQVIVDVLGIVEARLREWEGCGWRLVVPRARVYAVVLHAVIASARAGQRYPATLDGADILDVILEGTEPAGGGVGGQVVRDAIRRHTVPVN
ncbi:hypothetical protein [Nocardia jejuensis]|uniref:hypothetical protein n=1 Tax=Nocardia jejuensis TaxID=328049 RepID=UPI0008370A67|nr:hypothetical protein [Nocardia jejuensis]